MRKKIGQGLSQEMEAMLEFGDHSACDLCRVTVFVREYVTVSGVIPRHQRLTRSVPERCFQGSRSLRCCRRCIAYLDNLKRARVEEERLSRLRDALALEEQMRNKRIPYVLRVECGDVQKVKSALWEKYGDRVWIKHVGDNILRVELIILGWWSWHQEDDNAFFQSLCVQGYIRTYQKYRVPLDVFWNGEGQL